jgi:hypothetical protein
MQPQPPSTRTGPSPTGAALPDRAAQPVISTPSPDRLQDRQGADADDGDMDTTTRTSRRRRRHQDAGLLRAVPAFRGADPRRLAELATHTDRLRLPPGRMLVAAGEVARELVVVVAGEAVAHHDDGTTTALRPGAQIGGAEVVRHERHPATVMTTTEVEVVVVNGPAVLWAVREGLVGPLDRPAHEAAGQPAGTGLRGAGTRGTGHRSAAIARRQPRVDREAATS